MDMGFYDLSKEDRKRLVERMRRAIGRDLDGGRVEGIRRLASDEDTYVRKHAYLILGRLYRDDKELRERILDVLKVLFGDEDVRVRQTVVYCLGEVGKIDADRVLNMLEAALSDEHHSVRNAVVGALKQMGEKNPKPALEFAGRFLHHPDPEIRRMIIHGVELRGRTHPEDILPLLAELQSDPDSKVRRTVVHILGQISYKEGCLEKVVSELKRWKNEKLVQEALEEILDVHRRYERFSDKSFREAKEYIEHQLGAGRTYPRD